MNMGEVGIGLGAGVKDFRALMVFHSRDALNYFVEKGWASGAQADAAAKTSDKGGAVAGEAIVTSNISVYQLTCLLYTSPSPRDKRQSRMPSSA